MPKKMTGLMVDVFGESIYPAQIAFDTRIREVKRIPSAPSRYILPGLIDGHIHTESSMLIPSEFARVAVRHGTTGVVADPHEIANVLGIVGVEWMIRNSGKTPLRFFFGASPCVPATAFETAGAALGHREIKRLLAMKEVYFLSEMMNYPGVIGRDPEVIRKIALAKAAGKPVDGHAPGLSGRDLDRYLEAGIETDHECYRLGEAREKMGKGMKILVREGSAAKNLAELYPVLRSSSSMLCGDDTHPDDLLEGHMDRILSKCVSLGVDPVVAVKCCTRNTVEHYKLPAGLLREGDPADFVVVDDLKGFRVRETWIEGRRVFSGASVRFGRVREKPINRFCAREMEPADFATRPRRRNFVIGVIDGEIITEKLELDGVVPDIRRDILKIAVINRYGKAKPAVGYIRNFGIKRGALGSSVMHDSHNIGIVGADDASICKVANRIMEMKGGLAVFDGKGMRSMPLPFAGLMSGEPGGKVASRYRSLTIKAREMGCSLRSPFMTLSFMGLLVIPHLKISDLGMFDSDGFRFIR
ncbi:MAG: adenine deaminase [Candidatus Micrarchaeia archaeon]